ncbi:MAG TPA: hypothetical protein VK923_06290 [Euzebyales bacterium]|nr:hypothetical protein [Euzebyales bacterium]
MSARRHRLAALLRGLRTELRRIRRDLVIESPVPVLRDYPVRAVHAPAPHDA